LRSEVAKTDSTWHEIWKVIQRWEYTNDGFAIEGFRTELRGAMDAMRQSTWGIERWWGEGLVLDKAKAPATLSCTVQIKLYKDGWEFVF
jgi:hypothetical protein